MAVLGGLVLIAGCGESTAGPGRGLTPSPPAGPLTVDEAIARVNRNAQAMDFLLRAGGITAEVRFRQRDEVIAQRLHGTMLFRKPRDLYLKLTHPLGTGARGTIEAGSNDEEFWLWEKLDRRRYSWGRHDQMIQAHEADLPLRPDLLVEVLGLRPLPTEFGGPQGPVRWIGTRSHELIFLKNDPQRGLVISKTIDIARTPPYLVRSVVYFEPDGRPWMQATLDDYQPVAQTDEPVLAPHRLRLKWLPDRGWLELRIGNMKRFDKPAAERLFVSPRQADRQLGDVIRVDEPAMATLPSGPLFDDEEDNLQP